PRRTLEPRRPVAHVQLRKNTRKPRRERQIARFGKCEETGILYLVAIRLQLARHDATLEHRADVLRLLAVRLSDDGLWSAVNAPQPLDGDREAGLLPNFANHGVRGRVVELERSAGRRPASPFSFLHEQDTLPVADDPRD